MGKKDKDKSGDESAPKKSKSTADPGAFESLGKRIDDIPTVQSAEEMVRKAQAELAKAQSYYKQVRTEATEQLHDLRHASAGELTQAALRYVRRNPGHGVIISALLGFFLGRLFRR